MQNALKEFRVSTTIEATREEVWHLLVDVGEWHHWNSTIDRVEGKAAPGEKITLYTKANPRRAFPLRVVEFDPPSGMVWRGGMPLGLFRGERTYELNLLESGAVEFVMHEVYSGLLAPLIMRSIPDLHPSFEEFASSLKDVAENQTGILEE